LASSQQIILLDVVKMHCFCSSLLHTSRAKLICLSCS
jgi:hypothetical protein